ncbi:MAG: hypothetical protein AABX86_01800 [Nanoarchaeota archaeon]
MKKRGTKRNSSVNINIDEKFNSAKKSISELYFTLGIVSFSLGFGLFVTAIIRLVESHNPWITLLFGVGFMIVPVVFGIWKFEKVKEGFMEKIKKVKVD